MVRRRRLRAGAEIENEGAVAHRAREDVLDREAEPVFARVWAAWVPTARRLEREEAAARCGNAERAATVTAVGDRNDSRRNGGGRAAARAAWRALEIPGVFLVGPKRTGSVTGMMPNSGVLVLPTMFRPARS
jgi:hypothetical protein